MNVITEIKTVTCVSRGICHVMITVRYHVPAVSTDTILNLCNSQYEIILAKNAELRKAIIGHYPALLSAIILDHYVHRIKLTNVN